MLGRAGIAGADGSAAEAVATGVAEESEVMPIANMLVCCCCAWSVDRGHVIISH